MRSTLPFPIRLRMLCLTGIALLWCGLSQAQIADFRVAWIVVGDAAAAGDAQSAQAGKHLFMANDLAELSLKRVRVARLDVEPVVTSLVAGERFCLTTLRIVARAPDGSFVKRAPLSVSVRQDHRDALQLDLGSADICVRPNAAGEYPLRFTSLLPAADGSTRGAQIFIRVTAPEAPGVVLPR